MGLTSTWLELDPWREAGPGETRPGSCPDANAAAQGSGPADDAFGVIDNQEAAPCHTSAHQRVHVAVLVAAEIEEREIEGKR